MVLDHEHSQSEIGADTVNKGGQFFGLLRVHTGSRLIQQQQLRLGGKSACDLQTALLTVGQASSQFIAHILKSQHMQQVFALLTLTLFLICIQPEGSAQQVGRAAAVLGDEHVLKHGLALP